MYGHGLKDLKEVTRPEGRSLRLHYPVGLMRKTRTLSPICCRSSSSSSTTTSAGRRWQVRSVSDCSERTG